MSARPSLLKSIGEPSRAFEPRNRPSLKSCRLKDVSTGRAVSCSKPEANRAAVSRRRSSSDSGANYIVRFDRGLT
ncbi:hypothetical protein [Singulisphaera sp. PoT]|uniref:hypothetical protein n=1 Tax=Singulisphaera sp. PoT TaxID=3411797 RepID=UPI003BF5530B